MFRLGAFLFLGLALAGCAGLPPTDPASRQREQADLVLNFQSWDSISFLKPDITGAGGTLTVRSKTFTRTGVVKLLRNLKVPRDFVVVVLDRAYSPDPMVANGGMDEIQKFLQDLGFHRIAFQDGSVWSRPGGLPLLRDVTPPQPARASEPAAGR